MREESGKGCMGGGGGVNAHRWLGEVCLFAQGESLCVHVPSDRTPGHPIQVFQNAPGGFGECETAVSKCRRSTPASRVSAAVHSARRGRRRHTRATTTTPPDRSSPPDRSLPLLHRELGTRAVTTPLRAMHWQDLSVVQPAFVSRMSDGNVELVRRRLFARRASASRAACGRVGVDESRSRPGDVRLVGRPGLPSGRRAFAAPPLRRRLTWRSTHTRRRNDG